MFLTLLPVICSRTYCMDTLLQKTRETAIPLAKSVLEITLQKHLDSLIKKDFSKPSTENLGNINYCACYLLDNESFGYSISVPPKVLTAFCSHKNSKWNYYIYKRETSKGIWTN